MEQKKAMVFSGATAYDCTREQLVARGWVDLGKDGVEFVLPDNRRIRIPAHKIKASVKAGTVIAGAKKKKSPKP